MSARLRIQHRTTCTYDQPVAASHHQVRVTPMTTPEQVALRTRVDVRPAPWTHVHHDYWGTQVTDVEVHEPHLELSVTATSTVEVDRPAAPPPGGGWGLLRSAAVLDEHAEHLGADEPTRVPGHLAARARALAAAARWPADAAAAVCSLVHGEAVRTADGQHRVHLALGALRAAGVPARYVAGYRHPDPGAPLGTTLRAAPHAWLEWWCGDWYGWDPELDAAPGDHHVVVGRGRHHDDVPPLRGVHAGPARASVVVEVDVTRVA